MAATTKNAAAPRKTVAPAKKVAVKPIDLSELLKLPEQLEAGIQRIIEKMTQPVAVALPSVQTGADLAVERLEAVITLFTGKHAQNILQDMLDTGRPPTREQLLQQADSLIARSGK